MHQTSQPITIVKYHRNVTKQGNPSRAKTTRAIRYYSYGTHTTNSSRQTRGIWHDPDGAHVSYSDLLAWASSKARQHAYTYRLVLSVRDGPLQVQDFVKAMQASSANCWLGWRLIMHADTEHAHAHVIAFRDTTLPRLAFRQWRRETGAALAALEALRLQAVAGVFEIDAAFLRRGRRARS